MGVDGRLAPAGCLFADHLSEKRASVLTGRRLREVKSMKRVKAACILQTLVFSQKDDCGLTHEQQLKVNHDEVSR